MKYIAFTLLAFVLFAPAASAQDDHHHHAEGEVIALSEPVESTEAWDVYGEPMPGEEAGVSLSEAVQGLRAGNAGEFFLSGSIGQVCRVKGCWMILSDGEETARVTFLDYGFFVPTDSEGKDVVVFGALEEKEISEEDARHYAEDAEPGSGASIHGPQKELHFVARSVRIMK